MPVQIKERTADPPQLGCVLYLPGLPGGDSVIYDRSPYGNHGTITGAVWRRLLSSRWYLYHDGLDDYVRIAHAASLMPAQGTLMFWLNTAQPASNEVIISKDKGDGNRVAVWLEGNKLKIGLMKSGGWPFILAPVSQTFPADTWTHVAWTFGESGVGTKQYQNAADVTNAIYGSAASEDGLDHITAGDLILMLWSSYQEGGLALVQLHNRVFSALEIQNTFDREKLYVRGY